MGLDLGGRIRLLQPVYEPCGRQGCVTHKWQEVGEKDTAPTVTLKTGAADEVDGGPFEALVGSR